MRLYADQSTIPESFLNEAGFYPQTSDVSPRIARFEHYG
jgi:hypothetical protein